MIERGVVLITDSVDVLKAICNRAFDQVVLAEALLDKRKEVIFETASLSDDGEIEVAGKGFRVIPTATLNTFEVRMFNLR
jgi:hypothetical protein